jgi:hypothetical protein
MSSADRSDGSVTVVLGAGNYDILGFVDILDRMILHNEVVIIKFHPLRSYLQPIYDSVLAPLKDRGFYTSELDVDIATTKALIYHPLVSHIHLTGTEKTMT